MQLAVIDIGSNSIRYMEAELCEGGFGFSDKAVFTTRLAAGLAESGALAADRMEESLAVLRALKRRAEQAGLSCRCYATSAVRDARNRQAFLDRILRETRLSVAVLSGEEEARLAYRGATAETGGLIDIGGGSTQIVTQRCMKSYPAGCVRVRDWCGDLSLADMRTALLPRFAAIYELPDLPRAPWTAVGGTATTLAALSLGLTVYDSQAVRRAALTPDTLEALLAALDERGDEGRAALPLLEKRHDVILGGGLILLYLMRRIGIERLRFSDADGLEGFAMQQLEAASPAGGAGSIF